mgnify:CR=1 FL=1
MIKAKSYVLMGMAVAMLSSCGGLKIFLEAYAPEESSLNLVKITDELSSISAMYINENTLIVAGRKGQVQQDWQGGIYKVSL